MREPQVHGNRTTLTASNMLNALGDCLGEIRKEDRLTWAEVGAVMHKSDDMAAKYADGSAAMDVVAFGLAKRAWGSRFSGPYDRLIDCAQSTFTDRESQSIVLMAAVCLSESLAGSSDAIATRDLRIHRTVLEKARDAIEAQLAKIGPDK